MSSFSFAETELGWPQHDGPLTISSEFSMMEDPEGKYSLTQIQEMVGLGRFRGVEAEVLNLGISQSRYWLHVRLAAGEGKQGILELDEPSLDLVKCYTIRASGRIDSLSSGVSIRSDQKPVPGGRIAFQIEGAAQSQDLILRVEGRMPLLFGLSWYKQGDWESSRMMNSILLGGMLCSCILVVIFGLISFLTQKRLVYLFLFAYLIVFGAGLSMIYGVAYEFLFIPKASRWVPVFMAAGQPMLLLAFRMLLIEQKPVLVMWRKGIDLALLISLFVLVLTIVFPAFWLPVLVMSVNAVVAVGLPLCMVILYLRGAKGIGIYLIPMPFHMGATFFGALTRMQVFSISSDQKSIPLFCLLIEMGLFLSVIHLQYSRMKKARLEAELELERSEHQLDLLRARLAGMGAREDDSRLLEEDRSGIEEALADEQLTECLVNPLSARELEVLNAVSKGLTNRQVAESLFISVNTVKTHLLNIYEKLDAGNRTEASLKANQLNLLD